MPKTFRVASLAALLCTVSLVGCSSSQGSSVSAADPSPTRTIHADFQTFSSVAEITKKSTLVVRGHVTQRTTDLTAESNNSKNSDDKIPSIGREIVIDTIYKGSPVKAIWVIRSDPSKVKMEAQSQLTPNEEVILFLAPSLFTKDDLGVHGIWGADQGYVTLAGKSGNLRPQSHLESLPLPKTVAELEAQIRAAA